ncbi:hypothetical protein BpJC4_11340 [Weizmannia acidilactici]|uniref:hypothetical protein n=1 Tax=Weizmannia acidilactici TaxID=2607726 RepID=UPI001274B201|nr:hypothetical protein [Weizmannia acidilactici]GER66663.1 hypothetical protein BpJC4_11340 [Weizmannia acidilactici]
MPTWDWSEKKWQLSPVMVSVPLKEKESSRKEASKTTKTIDTVKEKIQKTS